MKTKGLTTTLFSIVLFISSMVSAQTYHPDDIGVLQNIIANNASSSTSLNWDTSTDTINWTGVTWNSETPKRISELSLSSKYLIGDLDVSGLTSLQYLYTQYNYDLAGIDASGLPSLSYLYCYYNNLSTLKLDGDTSLYRLECYNNIIDTLDVTSCRDLYYLYGYNNSLISLSVKGLANMYYLRVYNNPDLNFIDVEGCDNLGNVYVYNCSLLLSTIVPMYNLPSNPYISWYSQQNEIFILVNETIDFSDEALIDSVQTSFVLYDENNNQVETNTTGIFLADEAGVHYLEMNNSGRSITATIYVRGEPSSIPDLAVLEYIKNNNFTTETSVNWDSEPNPFFWDNVTWDLSSGRITELNLSQNNSDGTVYLTGDIDVSALSQLELFRCDGHSNVNSVDVSGLPKLKELRVSNTSIQSLNLSWLTSLESLYASELDDLLSVEFSGCANLSYVKMRSNPFKSMDFKGLVSLSTLDLQSSSDLEDIDLAGCNDLNYLYLRSTDFSSLNLAGFGNLTYLDLSYNYNLSDLDISGCVNLSTLYLIHTNLSSLDAEDFSDLTYLDLSYNSNLTDLDISGCSSLYNLNMSGTPFTSFDLTEFSNLTYLSFYGASSLEEVDLEGLTNLYSINLGATNISSINLSENTGLRDILFENAYELEDIDFSGCTYLNTLNLSGTNLTSVDVAGFTNLFYLYINRMANLEELDVEGATNLYYLYMESTGLPSLDLSGNTRIFYIDCDYSLRMDSINVSSCTNLYYLYSDYSDSLKSINLDGCTRLYYFYARYSGLEKVDISTCTNLYRVYLYESNLTELVHVGSSVRQIYVQNNKLPLSQTASIVNHIGISSYNISDQDAYPDVIIPVGGSVDYSADSLIDINGTDVTSEFFLYDSDGDYVDDNITGIFTINDVGEYYVELSNSGVTMTTGVINVIDGPGIMVSMTSTDFGLINIDSYSYQTLTIKNLGSEDLIVDDIDFPTGFSIDDVTYTIGAGGSVMVSVAFEPTSTFIYSGDLTVYSNATAGDSVLAISGTGGYSEMELQNTDLYFGYLTVGKVNTLSFTLTNSGTTDLNITGFSVPAGYSIEQSAMAVAPNSTVEVFVNFEPSEITTYAGTLSVLNDAVYGSGNVSLTGYGVERASGIDDAISVEKAILPNFVVDHIFLQGFSSNNTLEMYSAKGDLIKTINPNSDMYFVDVDNLKEGVYFIKENGGSTSYQFIKK